MALTALQASPRVAVTADLAVYLPVWEEVAHMRLAKWVSTCQTPSPDESEMPDSNLRWDWYWTGTVYSPAEGGTAFHVGVVSLTLALCGFLIKKKEAEKKEGNGKGAKMEDRLLMLYQMQGRCVELFNVSGLGISSFQRGARAKWIALQ